MEKSDEEPYENTFTLEELRREVRECWDREAAIRKAFRDLPEQPPYVVQLFLGTCAKWPSEFEAGKREQRRLGSEAVWYKTEIEGGAGLWARIRDCLRAARAHDLKKDQSLTPALPASAP